MQNVFIFSFTFSSFFFSFNATTKRPRRYTRYTKRLECKTYIELEIYKTTCGRGLQQAAPSVCTKSNNNKKKERKEEKESIVIKI